ncbi:MAG TPA: hypothetical protein VKQ54_11875 [Caulobacteraceae bacterium]|nr:hypothetical protein [Caulobacteraceae bacterium]
MSMLKALIVVAPLVLSTAAVAGPDRLTDAQYIAAARCQALMASSALGPVDMHAVDAVMKTEGASRTPDVADRADSARAQADRAARHAGPDAKASLVAERDGACHNLLARSPMSAAIEGHGTTRTN